MTISSARRSLLRTMGLALAGAGLAGRAEAAPASTVGPAPDLLEPGSDTLRGLAAKLAVAPPPPRLQDHADDPDDARPVGLPRRSTSC